MKALMVSSYYFPPDCNESTLTLIPLLRHRLEWNMANQRILLRPLNCLAVSLVLCLTPLCFAESVVVQVLGNDKQPVPHQEVTLELRYETLGRPTVRNQSTDLKGEARIELPEGFRSKSLAVEVNFTPDDQHCSCRVRADVDTVMREGLTVVTPAHGSKSAEPIQPTPGHIIFVAQPATSSEAELSGRSSRLKSILFGQ